jgi:phosphatidylserine/phosphatidylglycerophosphate/cardiolipin synthase-like enzyme
MAEVQLPKQFLADFLSLANQAKKHIYLQSLLFEKGDILSTLETVLVKKAKEGVTVHIVRDWVSQKYIHQHLPIIPPYGKLRQYGRQLQKENDLLKQKWEQAGIKFTTTNIPDMFSSPFLIANRNHIKMYIVDDTAAWIGGVNLSDLQFESIDFLVKFGDTKLITALSQQFFQINENRPKANYSIHCSENNTLLVDAGINGKSIIYDEAVNMIQKAQKKIIYASQFVPDGKVLTEIIAAAKRGVEVNVYTSHKKSRIFSSLPFNVPYKIFLAKTKQYTQIVLRHQPNIVHAKLLIVDEKEALFGSHNLVQIGVWLGTEEIAVATTEKDTVLQLLHFIAENMKNS